MRHILLVLLLAFGGDPPVANWQIDWKNWEISTHLDNSGAVKIGVVNSTTNRIDKRAALSAK